MITDEVRTGNTFVYNIEHLNVLKLNE